MTELLKTQEVRELLGVGYVTMYKMLKNKEIPCFKVGREYRVPKSALEQWIKEKQHKESC